MNMDLKRFNLDDMGENESKELNTIFAAEADARVGEQQASDHLASDHASGGWKSDVSRERSRHD